MTRLWMFALVALVAACGVKRPLIKPSDVPAYEEKLEKKKRRLAQDQETVEQSRDPFVEGAQ